MMKLSSNYNLMIAIIGCAFLNSCDTKTPEHLSPKNQLILTKNKTIENMQSAYKGEVTATAKYEAFAIKAEKEGYHDIATLYKAVSCAESIHAQNHLIVIEDAGAANPIITPHFTVKTTKENLEDDINGEAYEATTMYPEFLKMATEANNQIAFLSLSYAMKTEEKHKHFFEQALGDLNANMLISLPTKYYVCPDCGNTYSNAPNHCDFSLTKKENFLVFE
jgi:rubrerythrin